MWLGLDLYISSRCRHPRLCRIAALTFSTLDCSFARGFLGGLLRRSLSLGAYVARDTGMWIGLDLHILSRVPHVCRIAARSLFLW